MDVAKEKMMTVMTTATFADQLIIIFGGLALFLFGINLMSDSLKTVAGSRLRTIIEKTTNTPLKGIFVGIIMTMLIQSSSGTTALMIGLLRAGLMTLPQSVGVIMGANIGTTVTAFIIALPIAKWGLYFIVIGVVMTFLKNRKVKHIGGVILGLGMLFYGLQMMGGQLKTLAQTDVAESMFETFSRNPFLGTAFGTIFTMVIQSSSAAIGILETLYSINDPANGIISISLQGAIPILLGANIGTTITAFLASIGGNTESKRASFIHILFNIISAVVFLIILAPYEMLIEWVEERFLTPYSMYTIAIAHAFQNIFMTFVMYWFIKQMIWLSKLVVKDKNKTGIPEDMFDDKLITQSPNLALEFVKRGILYMGAAVKDYFMIVKTYAFKEQASLVQEGYEHEDLIDQYDIKLHDYLIKIAQSGLESNDSKKLSRDLDSIKDFERVGDHLTNILDFFQDRYRESQPMSDEGVEELKKLFGVIEEMINDTLYSFEQNDPEIARRVVHNEDVVDKFEEVYRYRHIERLKSGKVIFGPAENYVDILSNIERMADHLLNIAQSVIEPLYIPQSVQMPKTKEVDRDT